MADAQDLLGRFECPYLLWFWPLITLPNQSPGALDLIDKILRMWNILTLAAVSFPCWLVFLPRLPSFRSLFPIRWFYTQWWVCVRWDDGCWILLFRLCWLVGIGAPEISSRKVSGKWYPFVLLLVHLHFSLLIVFQIIEVITHNIIYSTQSPLRSQR